MKRLASGVLAVAVLALVFAAGVWVGGSGSDRRDREPAPDSAAGRAMYSPNVLGDPWFLERQRENVAALERQCAERGEFCREAREARRWLDEHD